MSAAVSRSPKSMLRTRCSCITSRHFASFSSWRPTIRAPRLIRTTSFTPSRSGWSSVTRAPSLRKTAIASRAMRSTSSSTGVTPRSPPHAMRSPRAEGRLTAAVKDPVSTGYEIGDRASGPATAASINATSSTVRAIGPSTPYESQASACGQMGTRPGEGRSPTTPQNAAGIRSEPPRSDPWASGPIPVASATAPPPVDPPHVNARFHGFRVVPKTALRVLPPAPNSGVFVLPTTLAPAARSRSTIKPSSVGTWCSKIFEPHVVLIPRVGVRSLMETGTPCNAPGRALRRVTVAVALRASASADSAATVQYALTFGFTRSIWASTACVTSSGETLRWRMSVARRDAGVKHRSMAAILARDDLSRIQRVAQAIADVVDGEHGEEDRGAREEGPVGGEVQVVLGVEEDASPRGNVRREAEPQEGERRLRDDGGGDVEGAGHDHGADRVREDVADDLAQRWGTEAARRLHELLLAQREELRAHEPRHRHPAQPADDGHDQDEDTDLGAEHGSKGIAKQIDHQQQQWKLGQGQKQIRDAHERVVHGASELPGGSPDHDADRDGDEHRGDADRERDTAAIEHASQQVLAEVIRAERMRPRGAAELRLEIDVIDGHSIHRGAGDDRHDHGEEHDRAEGGQPMAPEATERLVPERVGLRHRRRGLRRDDAFGRAEGAHSG